MLRMGQWRYGDEVYLWGVLTSEAVDGPVYPVYKVRIATGKAYETESFFD